MTFGVEKVVGVVGKVRDNIDLEGNRLFDSTQDTVDSEQNIRVTNSSELSYGRNNGTLGSNSQAIGIGAKADTDGTTATGRSAARNNTGNNTTATGFDAAKNNTGTNTTATGRSAAQNNTGTNTTATGFRAAQDNTGNATTATGFRAAQINTGNSTTVTGRAAARGDGLSDPTTMGDDNIGIGVSAIRNNQASGLIGIGQKAGINAQTDDQLIITDRNGNRRMVMDLTNGDLKIDGSLTQNATL
jgi:hypothetical protein